MKRYAFLLAAIAMLWSGNVGAKEITVGVVHTRLPYIIKDTDSGIEIDLVRALFKRVGKEVRFRYLTNQRANYYLKTGEVDAFLTNSAYVGDDLGIEVYISDVHITYHNHAITLSKNQLAINSPEDLIDKKVVGFQNAHKYLGEAYAGMTKANANYVEKPEQSIQVFWLFTGRTDVVVADINIFKYHRMLARREDKFAVQEAVTFHPIFAPSPIHGIFIDATTRDQFNQGLKQLKDSGEYDAILREYEKLMEIQ